MQQFDYTISNPPYQRDNQIGNKRVTTDIFPDFQELSNIISTNTVMIYPATWQKNINVGLGTYLFKNGLKKSYFYNSQDVFDKAIHTDYPISIVITEKDYNGIIHNNDNIVIDREQTIWLTTEIQSILFHKLYLFEDFLSGVTDELLTTNILDSTYNFSKNKDDFIDPVEVYIKAKPGCQADSSIWFISDSELPSNIDHSKYRVCVRSALFGRLGVLNNAIKVRGHLNTKVYPPKRIHSITVSTMKDFNSLEEAENFKNYFNSILITQLAILDFSKKSFASYVPDLVDYSSNNDLFKENEELTEDHEYYGLGLEHRLYKLFKLSEDEVSKLEEFSKKFI